MAQKKAGKPASKPAKARIDPKKDFANPMRRSPKQRRLAGMEDNAIHDIEELAIEHSDIQAEIAAKKVDLKALDDNLAALMRRENKKEYRRGSIHVRVRPGREAVSVQVKRHDVEQEQGGAEEEEVAVQTGSSEPIAEGSGDAAR